MSKFTKSCFYCEKEFTPRGGKATACYDKHSLTCVGCKIVFNLEVKAATLKKALRNEWFCSRACSDKYTREIKFCDICEQETTHRTTTGNCVKCSFRNRNTKKHCSICEKVTSHSGESCTVCVNKRTVNKKHCLICVKETPHQKDTCMVCVNKDITVRQKILTSGKYYNFKNVEEYLSLDYEQWSINFQIENGRLPTVYDFQSYFNTKNPLRVPAEYEHLFDYRRIDSHHELKFKHFLEERLFVEKKDFFRHTRFLKDESNKKQGKEIDFYFPEYMVGVEIQDFKTHSRDSDSETSVFNNLKRGPRAHREKYNLAQSYGVTIYEIWEDELNDLVKLEETFFSKLYYDIMASEWFGTHQSDYYRKQAMQDDIKNGKIKRVPEKYAHPEPKVWWND